jgi:alkaline phosphatase D
MRGARGYYSELGRRNVLTFFAAALVGCGRRCGRSPAVSGAAEATWGVQAGAITPSSAVVWSRADRTSRMVAEWSTSATFANARRVTGAVADAATGFTAKVLLTELPADTRVHYRVRFEAERPSEWIAGTLRTAPSDTAPPRDVVFAWSGDVNGQGWGIDPARGGMPAFATMLERGPEFFLNAGDAIYADDPIPPSIAIPGGGTWNNLVTDAKSRVAQTLDDFRGAWLYPRASREVQAFTAVVPSFSIWDDHEVRNNWFPGQVLDDPRYAEKDVDVLARFARRAMIEHTPEIFAPGAPAYRSFRWGPRLEVFLLDGRAHRTSNWPIAEPARLLGEAQLAWLEEGLERSRATWKVVLCDMPVGLVIGEPAPGVSGKQAWDAFSNEDGPPVGREVELARLFARMIERKIRNVVFLTADVHYATAIRYARAPIREFVAGPLHATAFGRKPTDDTFGPEVEFTNATWDTLGTPASPETQTFGLVRIDGATGAMTVTLVDGRGRDLHTTVMRPA